MTIFDGISAELPFLRAEAEALMTDVFTAYSPGDPTTVDRLEEPGFNPEGSTFGRLRVTGRVDTATANFVTIGEVRRPVVDGGLRIPITAPIPAVGWEYVLTTPGPITDPGLVGRRWRVMGVQADSYATARRLNVVEVS